jgi:hypothetical protein
MNFLDASDSLKFILLPKYKKWWDTQSNDP